jgi:hypothetical protein
MSDSVHWRIDGHHARVSCGPLAGNVLLGNLGCAFVAESWNGRGLEALSILSAAPPLAAQKPVSPAETYVRGNDLVCRFAPTESDRITPELYWRADYDSKFLAARIELVYSVHTELLDSRPQAKIGSLARSGPLWFATALEHGGFKSFDQSAREQSFSSELSAIHLTVLRNEDIGLSYAEMVHPTDYLGRTIRYLPRDVSIPGQPATLCLESLLFSSALEKGVIRRARICGWFMPVENDLETAVELAKRFVDEPLPLTT